MSEPSDPWIFLALYLTTREGEFDLSALIAAADAIEVAIPTKLEVEGALNRFVQAGLAELHNGTPVLTPLGHSVGDRAAEQATYFRSMLPVVRSLLGNHPIASVTTAASSWHTSNEEFDAAYKAYEARVSAIMSGRSTPRIHS